MTSGVRERILVGPVLIGLHAQPSVLLECTLQIHRPLSRLSISAKVLSVRLQFPGQLVVSERQSQNTKESLPECRLVDRDEGLPYPLENRKPGVEGLLEDPPIKIEPTEFLLK